MNDNPEKVKCSNCGEENAPGSLCWQCGRPVDGTEEGATGSSGRYAPPEPPRAPSRQDKDVLVILGFVLGAFGILCCCCPFIFSLPALILGAIAYAQGDKRGLLVMLVAVLGLLHALWWTWPPNWPFFHHKWMPPFPDRWQGPWHNV
ncbi:MAG: DUF4190 domain-containing protein [Armatimonadota bacterium]